MYVTHLHKPRPTDKPEDSQWVHTLVLPESCMLELNLYLWLNSAVDVDVDDAMGVFGMLQGGTAHGCIWKDIYERCPMSQVTEWIMKWITYYLFVLYTSGDDWQLTITHCSGVKSQLHDLQVALDDWAASAPRHTPLCDKARQYSGQYHSVDLGIRIILCSVLQVHVNYIMILLLVETCLQLLLQECYDRCVSNLREVSTDAVRLYQSDASRWFTPEVVDCMNHAFHMELIDAKNKDSHSDCSPSDLVSCKYLECI